MPIDPSIALSVRPPVIPQYNIQSPVDRLAQVLSLRNLMTQGQLGQLGLQSKQLELEQLQRTMQEQQDYAEAMRQYSQGGGAAPGVTGAPAATIPLQTAPPSAYQEPNLTRPAGPEGRPPVTAAPDQTIPLQTAPVQPTPIGGTAAQIAPFGLTGGPESVPGLANVGALPSPPPGAPLSALMTPQAAPPAVAPAAPIAAPTAMGAGAGAGSPRLAGLTPAQFIARFPFSGMGRIKEAFALDQAEAEAGIKQHDLNFKKADAMGRYAQAIKDSKDPAAQFQTSLMEAAASGDLDPAIARQMRDDGYEKHKNDIDAFIVTANNGKDYSEIQKNKLAAGLDDRKQFQQDMGAVNNQADYTKVLAIHPNMAAVFGDTFSPDLKAAAQNLTTATKDIPKAQMDAAVAAAQILEPARAKSQDAYDAALAQFPKYIQDRYRDDKTPLQVRQHALTAEQATTAAQGAIGKTEPKPQSVIDQELAVAKAKELAKADPFGLFAGTTGAPTTGAQATGVTPIPLAQQIATFEGFDKPGSVAQRNNNPGNLRAGPGATGTDKNGYAIFPDVNTGWAALHDLIQKHSGQDLTLQEFFGGKKGVYPGYAPAADRNDPVNYAATVAKGLGVDPTAKLSDIPGSQVPAARTRITPDMQGQPVLDALPGALAQQIKALAEGRMKFPTGQALKSPYWQQMLGILGQYDPSFDANNPGKRAATANAFAVGKEGQQVNALNTAIGHVDDLSKSADKLENTWSPAYNTVANLISKQMGRPAVNNFDTTKKAVVDELTRVWRGTGGSEADIKSWSQSLDAANSPDQLHGAIATIGRLLESKITALQEQYREGMGTISQGKQMITPAARKTLDRLEQKAGGTPAAAVNPNPGGYVPNHVYGGMKYLGGDPNNRASWQ